ncbi:MAG: DUF490 domain-containing protein, partial [Pseudomonadota bacterium]|nr:DUF490 domain-containing protein [Pseudomonadota bacterium]
MRKRTLSAILLSPVLILVALYAVLISPLGGPTVKLLANTFVENLSIDAIDGGFADTLEVHNVEWENPQWKVSAQYAYIDITWRCLFEPRVCVNEVTLENATLTQRSNAPDSSDDAPAGGQIELPLPIDVGYLALTNIKLALLTTTVEIDELELTDFEGNSDLILDSIAAKGVRIALLNQDEAASFAPAAMTNASETNGEQPAQKPASKKEQAPSTDSALPTSYSLSYDVPELPNIATPIPLSLGTFLVEDLHIIQGESKQHISLISLLEAHFKGSDVAIEEMTVVHEQGEVKGKASATLDGNFPLNVAINAKTKLGDTPQELSVAAAGALDDLTLSVVARGAVTANANLMANILDSNLPIEFTANWQKQAIPTLENTTLKEGQLTLSGTMGDYVLKGAGAATLPDIGNVPVSLDVVLKK